MTSLVLEREALCCVMLFLLQDFIGSIVGCAHILIARQKHFFRLLTDIRIMSDLACILRSYGLEHCEAELTSLGVYDFNNISYLTEWDVLQTGITLVDVRLLAISGAHWNLIASTAPSVDTNMMSELNSRATAPSVNANMMSELNSRAQQKEVEAIEALNACLTLATIQNINRCIPSIRDAIVRWQQLEEYTREAMLAFVATTPAQKSCSDRDLRNMIDKALKAVRENCVWRVQMTVTLRHRDAFLEALVRANGGPMS
jgi:hypothetical protein